MPRRYVHQRRLRSVPVTLGIETPPTRWKSTLPGEDQYPPAPTIITFRRAPRLKTVAIVGGITVFAVALYWLLLRLRGKGSGGRSSGGSTTWMPVPGVPSVPGAPTTPAPTGARPVIKASADGTFLLNGTQVTLPALTDACKAWTEVEVYFSGNIAAGQADALCAALRQVNPTLVIVAFAGVDTVPNWCPPRVV